jgi:hypothetical protein
MRGSDFSRSTVALCAAVSLAGCGGSQLVGAPGALSQTSALETHASSNRSTIEPGASNGDLLYVLNDRGEMYIFTYPGGSLVKTFKVPGVYISGFCADAEGNIFVTEPNESDTGVTYTSMHTVAQVR